MGVALGCHSAVSLCMSASVMSVLREIPFGGRFHRPRVRDFTFEESIDRTRDPLILWHEQRGSPIRDIVTGRVHVVQYSQSSQLDLNIAMIRNFIGYRENWTREAEDYEESERNFAKSLFTVLCYVKRNIDWREGGKPPIDRNAYDALMECYDFEPFRQHWSRRKRIQAHGYVNTIKLYYDTVNTDKQEEMLHQIQRDNNLTLFTGVVN